MPQKLLLPFLLLALLVSAASASAAPPTYKGASSDGEYLFFESDDQLVPGDTDSKRDVYVRTFEESAGEEGAYVTRQVSVGPTGGNDSYPASFADVSADGKQVFFTTEEALVAVDKDRRADIYLREIGGGTKLVSAGATECLPACGSGNFDAGFVRMSKTGTKVLFLTAEALDPSADTDGAADVYLRDLASSETYLVSAGEASCAAACGNAETSASSVGLTEDGATTYFATTEPLSDADDDQALDVYARALPAGPTALVSVGDPACAPCGNGAPASIFVAASSDGSRVTFVTTEKLVPGDDDGANDVYQVASGPPTLVSAGTETKPASFAAASEDGTRVFYTTSEAVLPGSDSNNATDVYMWQGSAPQLISSGSCCASNFGAATPDGSYVFFTTAQKLVVADGDESADVYRQAIGGGAPVLVSAGTASCSPCGSGEVPARFNRATAGGDRVFFTTKEALSPQDFDVDDDIYARDVGAGTTTLWTPPPGLCPVATCHAIFVDASGDGKHAVFQTDERLAAEDVDSEADIYERAYDPEAGGEVTRLASTGNSSDLDLGPQPPLLQSTSPASPGESTEPRLLGSAEPGSSIKVYPNSGCFGEPVAIGTAEELGSPGILVKAAAGATTTFWATAEADGFTSLCSNPVSYTQQAPPSGGEEGTSGGSPSGDPGSTADPKTDEVKKHDGVPYVKPLSRITFGPAAKTRSRRPVFRFTDTTAQPGTQFQCRVDRGRWAGCGSPFKLKRLRLGRHVFRVKAVNAVGVFEDRPASRAFKVVAR
jgi:Tol biopolymer transport system component